MTMNEFYMWVVQGSRASFPSAIFSTKEKAVQWIEKYKISGMLSKYPIDISIYDWTIMKGFFKPKRDDQKLPTLYKASQLYILRILNMLMELR